MRSSAASTASTANEPGDPAAVYRFAEQWLEQTQASFAVPQALWPQAGVPALLYPWQSLFQMMGWATGAALGRMTTGAWPWLNLTLASWPVPASAPLAPAVSASKPVKPEVNDLIEVISKPKAQATAEVLPFRPKAVRTADALTRIEGIGPKIAGLLNAAGITTFEELAGARQAHLRAVLSAAGPRFALAKPGSWPRQAKLLAKGDVAAFEALTAQLKAGA